MSQGSAPIIVETTAQVGPELRRVGGGGAAEGAKIPGSGNPVLCCRESTEFPGVSRGRRHSSRGETVKMGGRQRPLFLDKN